MTNLKLALAVLCLGALTAPVAMAQTQTAAPATAAATPAKEFVAQTPNVPQLGKPNATPMTGGGGLNRVPEPGSLALVAAAIAATAVVMRRRK